MTDAERLEEIIRSGLRGERPRESDAPFLLDQVLSLRAGIDRLRARVAKLEAAIGAVQNQPPFGRA